MTGAEHANILEGAAASPAASHHRSPDPTDINGLRQFYRTVAVDFHEPSGWALVHLDGPSAETRAHRLKHFDSRCVFFGHCPLCEAAFERNNHAVYR